MINNEETSRENHAEAYLECGCHLKVRQASCVCHCSGCCQMNSLGFVKQLVAHVLQWYCSFPVVQSHPSFLSGDPSDQSWFALLLLLLLSSSPSYPSSFPSSSLPWPFPSPSGALQHQDNKFSTRGLWQHVQNLENRTPVYTLRWRVLHLPRKQGITSQKIKTFKNTSKTVHKGYCTIHTGLETNQKFILTSSTTISKLHFDTHQSIIYKTVHGPHNLIMNIWLKYYKRGMFKQLQECRFTFTVFFPLWRQGHYPHNFEQ